MSDRLEDLFSGARARERWRKKEPALTSNGMEASPLEESKVPGKLKPVRESLTQYLAQLRKLLESRTDADQLLGPMVLLSDLEAMVAVEGPLEVEQFSEAVSQLDEVLAILLTRRRGSR